MARYRAVQKREESSSPLTTGLGILAGLGAAVVGGWILYSKLAIDHHVPLERAIEAERKIFQSEKAGKLSYYVNRQGSGRPLVLIHSINAAASAYEMQPLFNAYRSQRPVYALDLPGFGFSERSDRKYSPQLYENAILDFLMGEVGEAADVVALSLGSEFAARAALAQPEYFHSLVLISPSGMGKGGEQERGSQKASQNGMSKLLYPLFSFPLWSRPFYDLLTTTASIKYFLEQSFVGPVPQGLIDYDYDTGHQPGAENAPLYFVSGKLFTPNVTQRVFMRLKTPTLMLYDRDAFSSFEQLPEILSSNENWQAIRIIPTLGLPQFERLSEAVDAMDHFWQGLPA